MVYLLCKVYRSNRKEGMYLFVESKEDLARVPPELLQVFGKPEFSMQFLLGSQRKLARADAQRVAADIAEKGFYLQMPPEVVTNDKQ
jgi:uncharacterized protein YcgL (UPF0745 family)